MSKPYFRQLPDFNYINRNAGNTDISNYIPVKNFFKRGVLRPDIFHNLSYFTKYKIVGDERPDNIAYNFYNDPTLDWLVLISNNIVNVQTEWPIQQTSFDQILLDKYGSYDILYSGIHHYETSAITNSSGTTILPAGLTVSPTWKTNGNFIEITNTKISQIFSGDGVTPSTTVTVTMNNGILGLNVGSEVVINNVSQSAYNGRFRVTSIYVPFNDNIARSFTYQLPSAPGVASPTMSTSHQEEVLFTVDGGIAVGNSYYYQYYDGNLGHYVQIPSNEFVVPVTNYEYEQKIEDDKRNIYVLKPQYLNVVFNDLDTIMPYKQGAAQYVNRTLKQGDNIRLTS